MKLKDIKLEYIREELNISDLNPDPMEQFHIWMQQVVEAKISYPNAAILSTVDKDGVPSSRTILLKDYHENGLTFFTDYTSAKAIDLQYNKNVSLLLFWKEFDRQIRIKGVAHKIDHEESAEYWASRPKESQISAHASNQSAPITKEELYQRVEQLNEEYKDRVVPCPNNWGGYAISLKEAEFWQGRPNRLHDRFKYLLKDDIWTIQRLCP